jgi:hypothetical protein
MNTAADRGRRALILLDFQRDFLADDGRMPVARHHVAPVLAAARRAADQARLRGDLVIKVGNEFRRGDIVGNLLRRRAAIAGSAGTAWDDRTDVEDALYVPKSAGSAFTNPALGAALDTEGVQHLTIGALRQRLRPRHRRSCPPPGSDRGGAQGRGRVLLRSEPRSSPGPPRQPRRPRHGGRSRDGGRSRPSGALSPTGGPAPVAA